MKRWLMLRGTFDERTLNSINTDDDLYPQLFAELVNPYDFNNYGEIFFRHPEFTKQKLPTSYKNNIYWNYGIEPNGKWDYIFSRGAFGWQSGYLKRCPEAYKIRYSSGDRFMPEPEIDYQLILVDTEAQKQAVLDKYPGANVHLFIKPAAAHFKPIECEKEYDVCFIANEQQRAFKGIDWVYETAPKDLKILHLGYHDTLNPPDNITCKRVDRIDMPRWINKCRVGVVPYGEIDSCPRVIPEMLACGLPVVCLDTVNFWRGKYLGAVSKKEQFWNIVNGYIRAYPDMFLTEHILEHYKENLSIPVAANHIKSLIKGSV